MATFNFSRPGTAADYCLPPVRALPQLQLVDSDGVLSLEFDPEPSSSPPAAGPSSPPIHQTSSPAAIMSVRRGPTLYIPAREATAQSTRQSSTFAKLMHRTRCVFWACVCLLGVGALSSTSALGFLIGQATMGATSHGPTIGWLVVSLVLCLSGGALSFTHAKYMKREVRKGPSSELGIELEDMRRRPEPEQPNDDNAQDQFWKKFAQDETQLRQYVEKLEDRVKWLEQELARANEGSVVENDSNETIKIFNRIARGGGESSLTSPSSTKHLLEAETPERANVSGSTTQGSILTQLCAGVTVPYSPLDRAHEAVSMPGLPANSKGKAPEQGRPSSLDIISGRFGDM